MKYKERVTYTYKKGFSKTEFKNISDKHLIDLQKAVNNEILRRQELKDHPELAKAKDSFFKKLSRFFRRLNAEIQYHAKTTAVNHIVGSEHAAAVNYIGLIEE